MARFRKIDPRIWNDEKFMSLNDESKLLFFMLLTHPHLTMLGAMRATLAGLAEEVEWDLERFSKRFSELLANGLVNHDKRGKLVHIGNYLKYNSLENPNQVKGAFDALDLLPECKLKDEVLQTLKPFVEQFSKQLGEQFGKRFGKGFAKQGAGEGTGTVEGKEKTIPPKIEDVISYCKERNNGVDVNKWYDFYSSKGWMIGKNKMKDWKAAVRTWEKKSEKTENSLAGTRYENI